MPEIGLPVVKVIVPGLRHFWARFAPGRLYDVPVKLGWLPRAAGRRGVEPDPDVSVRRASAPVEHGYRSVMTACLEKPVDPTWVLSLPEYVTVAAQADGELTLLGLRSPVTLRQLSPGAARRPAPSGGAGGKCGDGWRSMSARLTGRRPWRAGTIICRTWPGGVCCVWRSMPAASGWPPWSRPRRPLSCRPPATLPGRSYVLSRFAWMQRRGDVLALESPLSPARIVLHDPRAAALVHALARPGTAAEVGGRVAGLPAEAVTPLLGLLVHAGAVCAVGDDGATAEDADPALRCWQFHDLLFHARSRRRTTRRARRRHLSAGRTARPAARPPAGNCGREPIALHRPDLERLQARIRPSPGSRNAAARSASTRPSRSRTASSANSCTASPGSGIVKQMEVETPAGPVRMDFASAAVSRPAAPCTSWRSTLPLQACRGLAPGLYRYDGLGHRLVRRAGRDAEVERLLADAALAAGLQTTTPQVLLVLAARLPRVAWKYTGLAYALVLKHVGVVFQTMYLAATAMGLAPCAVGLGDSDLFAQAAGVDYYAETSVGEFLLGSAPAEERQG